MQRGVELATQFLSAGAALLHLADVDSGVVEGDGFFGEHTVHLENGQCGGAHVAVAGKGIVAVAYATGLGAGLLIGVVFLVVAAVVNDMLLGDGQGDVFRLVLGEGNLQRGRAVCP